MAGMKFKRHGAKQSGKILDSINLIFGLLIIVCAIVLVIDVKKFMFLFPAMFFFSAVMNCSLGIKKYKMDEYAACIVLCLVALFLAALSVFSLVVVI